MYGPVCVFKKVEDKESIPMKQVNICKSSDVYINIFDGSSNNHLRTRVSKKVEKKSIP